MEPPRMQQTMPEDRSGWHQIDAGPHLEILFHPDRTLARPEPDEIERPSIVVAVTGKREQALRFDPFSMGAHFHIRPGLARRSRFRLPRGRARSTRPWLSSRSRCASAAFSRSPRRTVWHRSCVMKS